jgi:hypothetical protein
LWHAFGLPMAVALFAGALAIALLATARTWISLEKLT